MRDTGKGEKKREKINMAISRRYPRRRKKRKGIPLACGYAFIKGKED